MSEAKAAKSLVVRPDDLEGLIALVFETLVLDEADQVLLKEPSGILLIGSDSLDSDVDLAGCDASKDFLFPFVVASRCPKVTPC